MKWKVSLSLRHRWLQASTYRRNMCSRVAKALLPYVPIGQEVIASRSIRKSCSPLGQATVFVTYRRETWPIFQYDKRIHSSEKKYQCFIVWLMYENVSRGSTRHFQKLLSSHFTLYPLWSQILWLILCTWHCAGEKLSPDQKAPLFARGSGGLALNIPFEDNKARNRPITSANAPAASAPVDDVQREETEMLKLVDGELVRTVKGSFSYKSPEGLPISVKWATIFSFSSLVFLVVVVLFFSIFILAFAWVWRYEADENGNRASFKFGTGESSSSQAVGSRSQGGRGGGDSRNNQKSKVPSSKSDSLPPKDVDRSYLPPQ